LCKKALQELQEEMRPRSGRVSWRTANAIVVSK
jgi:hypothetical protein